MRPRYEIVSTVSGNVLFSWGSMKACTERVMRYTELCGEDIFEIRRVRPQYEVYVAWLRDDATHVGSAYTLHGARSIAGRNRVSANVGDNTCWITDNETGQTVIKYTF